MSFWNLTAELDSFITEHYNFQKPQQNCTFLYVVASFSFENKTISVSWYLMCVLREKKLGVDAFPIFQTWLGTILLRLLRWETNVFVQIRSGIEGSLLISPIFCHPMPQGRFSPLVKAWYKLYEKISKNTWKSFTGLPSADAKMLWPCHWMVQIDNQSTARAS